jgi:Ca2+-binding RTX toxin-like protein
MVMNAFLSRLFGVSKKEKSKARRRDVFRTNLRLEGLERRDNPAGIGVAWDAATVFMDGSAGDDTAYISINTHGDNNAANDTLVCKLVHGGVTETKTFDLYKQTANGLVQQITRVQFEGHGGSDKVVDFGNLSLYVFETQIGGGDEKMMAFDAASGKFAIEGTSLPDTVNVTSTLAGMHVAMHNYKGGLDVYKPIYFGTPQGVKTVISSLYFAGHAGNDHFTNSTWVNTHAYGGAGQDWLQGGSGNDLLDGDKDEEGDTYPASGDQDILLGSGGDDTLYGDQGDDWLYGGDGKDTIYGGEGNDNIDGGTGNDYLSGNEGKDIMSGGSGDDQMLGGAGDDKLYGWSGNDTMEGDEGNDYLDGGADWDYLEDNYGNNVLHGGDGADQIFVGHAVNVGVNPDVNYVYGEAGSDMLVNLGGTAYIHGGDGHDQLLGAAGGTGGNDFLYGEGGDDEIVGGKNGSVLDGGNGDDWIIGGDGNDTIKGGAGRDLLIGGLGQDNIDGGLGDDILIGGGCSGNAADKVHDTLTGGPGNDKFQRDDNGQGGDFDTFTDYAAGDLKLTTIAWGQWFTDVQFQQKGKPVN